MKRSSQAVIAGLGIAFISAHTVAIELDERRLSPSMSMAFRIVRQWSRSPARTRCCCPRAGDARFPQRQGRAVSTTHLRPAGVSPGRPSSPNVADAVSVGARAPDHFPMLSSKAARWHEVRCSPCLGRRSSTSAGRGVAHSVLAAGSALPAHKIANQSGRPRSEQCAPAPTAPVRAFRKPGTVTDQRVRQARILPLQIDHEAVEGTANVAAEGRRARSHAGDRGNQGTRRGRAMLGQFAIGRDLAAKSKAPEPWSDAPSISST